MTLLQALVIGLLALIIAPGYLFYFDVTPKIVVLLAGSGLALPGCAGAGSIFRRFAGSQEVHRRDPSVAAMLRRMKEKDRVTSVLREDLIDSRAWYRSEHVQEYRPPANVEQAPAGAKIGTMLADGELAAAIGAGEVDSPNVAPLIPDSQAAAAAWYRRTGIYPINHTVVIKDALLQADPTVAPRVYQAFVAAKERFMQRLRAGEPLAPAEAALARRRDLVGDDPLPYGLAANRAALEALAEFAYDQHIVSKKTDPASLFLDVEAGA